MTDLEGRRRARTEAQKQRRREALLDNTWRLFQEQPYEGITMALVAARAGLAKGTPYRYVRTKEELFLAVAGRQFAHWFDGIDAALRAGTEPWSPEQAATLLSRSLAERPDLVRLLGLLHPVLEQNAGTSAIGDLKGLLVSRLAVTGPALEARVAAFAPGQGAQLLLRLYALVIGLRQLATSPREPSGAPEEPYPLAVDFASELEAALVALARGMAVE